MSNAVCVVGRSGTGKSTSLENLPPEETFIIACTDKNLPFRGARNKYTTFSKENLSGNHLVSDKSGIILKTLQYINENRKDIKYVILDDFIYMMNYEFFRRGREKSYDKYNDMAVDAGMVLMFITNSMRDDINVAILTHEEEYQDAAGIRQQKVKTLGRALDNNLNIEGMFETVLYTDVSKDIKGNLQYRFTTQNTGNNTGKSPRGMFDDEKIPNDLKYVFEMMDKYYFEN